VSGVALRAVHDDLIRAGEPCTTWRRLIATAQEGRACEPVDESRMGRALRSLGVRAPARAWVGYLRQLGVLAQDGHLVRSRAEAVSTALELVGDSFADLGTRSCWHPVATVPAPLRSVIRPPVMRQTAGVLLDLLDRAETEVRVAAPYVDDPAVEFLTDALLDCGRRGVEVHVLSSVGMGARFDALGHRWPDGALDASLTVAEVVTRLSPIGSHAKVVLADSLRGYVGSANLTSAGMGRHVEVGVLVEGPHVSDFQRVLVALERVGSTRRWGSRGETAG
jgi:hypothetical protein